MKHTGGSPNLFIIPEVKEIIVTGKVHYNEFRRRIHLKPEILIPFLNSEVNSKGKIINLTYRMELYLDKEKFNAKIAECNKNGILPVLLFFERNM